MYIPSQGVEVRDNSTNNYRELQVLDINNWTLYAQSSLKKTQGLTKPLRIEMYVTRGSSKYNLTLDHDT